MQSTNENKVKTYSPNAFRCKAEMQHIVLDFGLSKNEDEELSTADVEEMGRLILKPSQILPLVSYLALAGAQYQKKTGEDIGFASFLEGLEDDEDEE